MRKQVVFFLFAIVMFSACSVNKNRISGATGSLSPQWLNKEVYLSGNYVYSVGHSPLCRNEQEARDEARTDALRKFVNYSGTQIEVLNRIYESYSEENNEKRGTTRIESGKQAFARAFVRQAVAKDWHIISQKKKYKASVLLQIPKTEYERITTERNIKLSLDVYFFHEGKDGRMQNISEGDVLKSGDGYAIYVKPSNACYIYVYQVDASDKSFRLFPNPQYRTASNPVNGGTALWIPNDKEVFYLDETSGKEFFYIFASLEKVPEFEGDRTIKLSRQDLNSVGGFTKMGPKDIRAKLNNEQVVLPKKNSVVEVKNKLMAEGNFVYETWFWHK